MKRLNSAKEARRRQAVLVAAESDYSECAAVDKKSAFLKELEDFKSSIDLLRDLMAEMESSYERAENVLQDELKKREEMLHARGSVIKELEESVHILRPQLSEKEELLKSRDKELEGLTSEVNDLTARLAEMEAAKERAESLLQNELRKQEEMLQVRDSATKIIEVKESLSAQIQNQGSPPIEKKQTDPFEILLPKSR